MKKIDSTVIAILVSFVFISFLSCADEIGNRNLSMKELDAETERMLKEDYWRFVFNEELQSVFTVDDVKIDYYLGTYNGYVIFVVSSKNINPGTSRQNFHIPIGDYEFIFPAHSAIYAWKQGDNTGKKSFFNLSEVSINSLSLTQGDVKSMYEKYSVFNIIKKENFFPGAFEGLNENLKRQIKNDWWHDIFNSLWQDRIPNTDDVWIDYYLGTYNDYVIIAVLRNSSWTCRITLNGYDFVFPSDFSLYAWKQENSGKGVFYRILNENDFNSLSLTHSDAENMHKRYLSFNNYNDVRLNSGIIDSLDAETARQIKSSFNLPPDILTDDLLIYFYLGTYNEYIVFVNLTASAALTSVRVGDFSLGFNYGSNAYAWNQHSESLNGQLMFLGRIIDMEEKTGWDDVIFVSPDDAKNMYIRYLKFYNKGIN